MKINKTMVYKTMNGIKENEILNEVLDEDINRHKIKIFGEITDKYDKNMDLFYNYKIINQSDYNETLRELQIEFDNMDKNAYVKAKEEKDLEKKNVIEIK